MSTTTQILFNSPALHSLKRDQLVKLCKIHSIKASGKNLDLIQKLRQHAQTLPKDSPLSIAARSESDGPISVQAQMKKEQHEDAEEEEEAMNDEPSHHGQYPRQSEQWEMVMDSIQEEEEGSSQGTLTSQRTINNGGTGEFGTGSSKASSVGSSIKALATSLGLKRGNSKASSTSSGSSSTATLAPPPQMNDELALKSTPYSSLPESTSMPQTDHFTLDDNRMSVDGDTEVPLPGHALRPGLPAPANARLSMGFGLGAPATPTRQAQPTTTIRLVNHNLLSGQSANISYGDGGTPQLKPFKTNFDLSFGSPAPTNTAFGFGGTSMWPPRNDEDVQMRGIYPTLTFDDLPPSVPASPVRLSAKSPEPFMFGSPHPKDNVSNNQFRSAAAAVLEEMNQRLKEDGVDEIGLEIISKLHPGAKKEPPREIKPIPASKRGEITDKFQKMHDQEFQKMQGIDDVLKKRTERSPEKKEDEKVVIGRKRKSNALERDGGGSRRPSALAGRASATRVISNGRRAKAVIPGAFGLDDDEDDEEESDGNGKRARMDPEAELSPEDERKREAEELLRAAELEKEKEAIRKKLEANRARRRSSAAHGAGPRKSVGRPRPSVLQKPKPKPSRFGFLSSAKTLVQNVWNRGKAADAAPSKLTKPMPTKTESVKEKMGPPSLIGAKKSAAAPARPTTAVASGSKPPSIRVNNGKEESAAAGGKGSIASSSRSRSPLPSFNTTSRNSILSNGSTRTSRSSLLSGPGSRAGSVAGTAASKTRPSSSNISSVGTRASSRLSATDPVSSMGSKKIMTSSSVASRQSSAGTTSSRLSSTSRLLAPTASSLAKAHRSSAVASSSNLKAGSGIRYQSPIPSALGMITNSPSVASPKPTNAPHNTFSPRPGGIFSTPLALPPQSGIPTPIKKRTSPSGEASRGAKEASGSGDSEDQSSKPVVRSLNGRKPRISRSKVIARLASQRAATNRVASGSSVASGHSGLAPRVSSGGGKTRSSIGAKVSRASYGGGVRARPSAGGAGNVVLSAKKRARQSEYARRRSRVGPLNFDGVGAGATAAEAD